MYDLIYTDSATKDIETAFPQAKIEDASDFIHHERISVGLDIEDDEWFKWLLKNGYALASISYQLLMIQDAERAKRLAVEAGVIKG